MARRKKMGESQILKEAAEGQEGKSNATAIDDSCNFRNTSEKRRRSMPPKQDFTALVKRGRKDKRKKRVLLESCGEKENDSVSLVWDATKAAPESPSDGAVFELPKLEKNGFGQNQEKVEGTLLEIVFNNNKEEEGSKCDGYDFTAAEEGKFEDLLVQRVKKNKRKRGKGKRMDFDAEQENVENIRTVKEEIENLVSEGDGKMGCEKNHIMTVKEVIESSVSEGDEKMACEKNHIKTVKEEVENPVSEGDGKMGCEENGQVQEEARDLGEENRKGHYDAGCGALKKRESSRRALEKMEEMKQEWDEWSEEEEVGRREKKRGRKRKKNGGDSVVEADRGREARKKRSPKVPEDAEEEEEKVSGCDGEPIVDEEKEQAETRKKKRGRRPAKGDKDEEEEQKLEGSNLSRQERYSLRTKKMKTDNTPKLNKRCRDENGNIIESNMCHQCQRNDKGEVVRCRSCGTKRYCVPCMTRWYKSRKFRNE